MYFYGFYSMQLSYTLIYNTLKWDQDQENMENMGKSRKGIKSPIFNILDGPYIPFMGYLKAYIWHLKIYSDHIVTYPFRFISKINLNVPTLSKVWHFYLTYGPKMVNFDSKMVNFVSEMDIFKPFLPFLMARLRVDLR